MNEYTPDKVDQVYSLYCQAEELQSFINEVLNNEMLDEEFERNNDPKQIIAKLVSVLDDCVQIAYERAGENE